MFIKILDEKIDEQKFVMIEFQGTIENSNEEYNGKILGSLKEKQKDIYNITIGMHLLEGKKIKLEKPILVLKNNRDEKQLIVQGICREKILFNQRPLPIFNNQQSKKLKEPTKLI